MSLSPQFLDELRARTTLSTLIGKTVKITRAGREFKACCPFHNEKTPSFTINDEKGFYHCFGCGAHGDAIRWMTEQRGLSFMDAIKELAATAGMDVPAPDPRAAKKAERNSTLLDVMASAQSWFVEQLQGLDGRQAAAYLDRRGLSPATVKTFGLGFAPDARGRLKGALEDKHPLDQLVETGMLIKVDDKEPYDRFRGRMMIPIKDARGRVIAFGGRIIGDGEPKYLNSPDTPLFDKGRTLYNLDRASPASRKSDRIIVVEGYMDVIALAQAGIEDAVAPLGTALTEQQIEMLWRMIDVPTLCFDGDGAGQKAAIRAAKRAAPILKPKKSLKFVILPAEHDPDDIIRNSGAATFENIVKKTTSLDRLLYTHQKDTSEISTPEGRAGLKHDLMELADQCENQLIRSEYRSTFNDYFYDDFGWKSKHRSVISDWVDKTSPRKNGFLNQLFIRSVFYGVSRFPSVLRGRLEDFSNINVELDSFKRCQDVICEAFVANDNLQDDAIREIIESTIMSEKMAFNLQKDIRFPWVVGHDFAIDRLRLMIDFIAEEQVLDEEMERIDFELKKNFDGPTYERLERARQIYRERKAALFAKAAEWEPDSSISA